MASEEAEPKVESKEVEEVSEEQVKEGAAEATETSAEAVEEERIRGGGKVSDRGAGRSGRRHAPYDKAGSGGDDKGKGRRLYVGNLSYQTRWQDLKDHMKTAGDVTHADVMMGRDGRSKGCGIVEFATVEGAQEAIESLNDSELDGRKIFVREDREAGKPSAASAAGAGSQFSAGEQSQSKRVYVGNLSWDVAWQDLKDHMREAGDVLHAEVITEANGRSKGCGIVEYATEEEAQEAISTLTDTELKGRMIFVREDRETGSSSFHHGSGGHGGRHGTAVYVWNLAYETTWQNLKDHMRAAGNVDQANILTGPEGQSIGCATVVYQRPQEAARAIRELQGSELDGRPISIREDRVQPSARGSGSGGRGGRGRGGFSGRGGRGGRGSGGGSSGLQLYVGNLSWDTTWQDLKDHFRQCGEIDRVDVMEYPDGRKKGFGTVRFFKQEDANQAIQDMDGIELDGRALEVRLDHKA